MILIEVFEGTRSIMQFCHPKVRHCELSAHFAIDTLTAVGRLASAIQREANKGKQVPHTTTFAKGKCTLELRNVIFRK